MLIWLYSDNSISEDMWEEAAIAYLKVWWSTEGYEESNWNLLVLLVPGQQSNWISHTITVLFTYDLIWVIMKEQWEQFKKCVNFTTQLEVHGVSNYMPVHSTET
jgi:hypothetical protein